MSTRRTLDPSRHGIVSVLALVIAGCGGVTLTRTGEGDPGAGNGGFNGGGSGQGGTGNGGSGGQQSEGGGGNTGSCDPSFCPVLAGRPCCATVNGPCGSDNGMGCVVNGETVGDGGTGQSCKGLAATCGPSSKEDCCSSSVIPGGTFYRSYDGVNSNVERKDFTLQAFPATVSDFRLDTYEITVGRFRRFVAAYSQNMIPNGAGRNKNNPTDPGWTWSAKLPADAATLASAVKCGLPYQTWTDSSGANENRPMNCISWYEAFAFCVWDGGRLPTEAEWNYAASGGSEQREYPWGSIAPDCMYANHDAAPDGAGYCVGATNDVGSESPKGNGKWGQSDLAGNVWEWILDTFSSSYQVVPCIDCADTTAFPDRVFRGGGFDSDATALLSSNRYSGMFSTSEHYGSIGARCARKP